MSYRSKRFFFGPLILVALAVVSLITMLLWNVLMPEIFQLPEITFWQAAGLLILSRLFFGIGRSHRGWHQSHWRNKLHNKMSNMTPEERKEFFQNMHYNRRMWHRGCYGEEDTEQDQGREEKKAE